MKLMRGVLVAGLLFGVILNAKIPEGYLGSIFPSQENQGSKADSFYVGMQSKSSSLLSEKNVLRNYVQAVCNEILCRQVFHMTLAQKEQMKKLSYDDFVATLLRRDDLCDEAVMALWCEYKQKRSWNWSNEKFENEIKVKDGLEKRRKDREKQQRSQQQEVVRIQSESKKYNPKMLQNLDYVSPYQKQREVALQQTVSQSYVKHAQIHMLDAQTAGMLQAEGIDHRQFQNLSGTIFQHQLFGEVAQHYKNAAKIMFEYSIKNSCVVPHILEFAQATFDATKMEQLGLAVQLSDIAELLAERSLSICKGPIQSLCGLAETLCHPRETAKQLGQALVPVLRSLGGALAMYDHEGSVCVTSMHAAQKAFGNDMQSFNQMCDFSKHAFLHWYEHSSDQDKIQAVSKVACDIMLQPFLIGKAGKACWSLLSQARELQVLEGLSCLSEELGYAEIAQDLAQIANKEYLITAIGELEASLGSLIEAELVAVQKPISFLGVMCEKSFIENIELLQVSNAFYKNTLLQKQAMSYFNQYFYQKELLEFCAGVEKTHSLMMVEYMGKEVEMLCNPRHMMTYQLEFRTSLAFQKAEGCLGGGHVGLYVDDLVQKGFLKIRSERELVGGCRALELGHVFGKNIAKKTIWPKKWDAEQIMGAINQAWHNQVYADFEILNDKSSIGFVIGKTKENVLIEMHIKEFAKGGLKLKTAYPYNKEFSSVKL